MPGYVVTPLLLGAAATVYRLLSDGMRSADWPLGCASIIAALIIAAALGLFDARKRWPGVVGRQLTNVLWYWPALALILASDRAADGEPFSRWEDAVAAGGLVTLLVTVGNLAALSARFPKPPQGDDDG